MDLSRNQLTLLKKAKRKEIVCEKKKWGKIVAHLIKERLIDFRIQREGDKVYYLIRTNETGKAVLHEKTTALRRANIAIVISVVALLLSILTAFTPFPEWSKGFIEALLQ